MVKFDPKVLTPENQGKVLSEFYKAATLIESYEEAKTFFKDLLPLKETAMLARRLQIARMLIEEYTYDEIKTSLKIGSSTISKIQNWLEAGGTGYRNVIRKIQELEIKKTKSRSKDLLNIKTRYASYYWPAKSLDETGRKIKLSLKKKSIPFD